MKRPSTNIKRDNSIKRVASNIIDSKKQNFIKKESTPILTTNLQSGVFNNRYFSMDYGVLPQKRNLKKKKLVLKDL